MRGWSTGNDNHYTGLGDKSHATDNINNIKHLLLSFLISILRTSSKLHRLFVLCGQGSSLLWTSALRPYSGPVRLPRESKGIGRCVLCMLVTCREGGIK